MPGTGRRQADVTLPTVQVTARGDIPDSAKEYAVRKISGVPSFTREPVLALHVVLALAADPARRLRASAEASLDLNGRPMHVQVEAEYLTEAIDLLVDRLRRRLVDSEDRHRSRRRDPGPDPQDG